MEIQFTPNFTPTLFHFFNTNMASRFFPNLDEYLDEGESSNPENTSNPNMLTETPPEAINFVLNLPQMATQWYTAIQDENTQTPPPLPKKKRKQIRRDREGAEQQLQQQYFNQPPERMYDDAHFRGRYRMRRSLFLRIVEDVTRHDPYFQQKPDACGRLGFSPIHKCTVAMRHLAYGASYDQLDEHFQIAKETVAQTVKHFAKAVIAVYNERYLRPANDDDVARLAHVAAQRGFPGMLGSIDCMHWEWKNCPVGWQGQFQGRSGTPSIILEAVASYDTHIWHAFFGMSGANNDINVLNKSPLFDDVCEGRRPRVPFVVNNNPYSLGYYLTDGIYPRWAAFMPAYTHPNEAPMKTFTKWQESYRKDVERAFGVLQGRFAVIRSPAKYMELETIRHVMIACIILHNMIVEDERDTYGFHVRPEDYEQRDTTPFHYHRERHADLATYGRNWREIRDRDLHNRLKHDLTIHVHSHFGGNEGD